MGSATLAGAAHIFDRAIDMSRADEHVFDIRPAHDFWVGNLGPNGGYVAALFARAIEQVAVDDRNRLLTLTLHLMRPLKEAEAQLVVVPEKQGNRLSNYSIRAEQDGRTAVFALAVVGHNPVDERFSDLHRPASPAAEELPERGESHHAYIQHYEMRPAFGGAPWSGRDTSCVGGWIRMRAPRALDTPLLAALTDTWMPAMWPRLTEPAGKMTVDLTIHFRGTVPADDRGWWFVRQTARHAEGGFADEDCEVWASDGTLLAQSRQLCLLSR